MALWCLLVLMLVTVLVRDCFQHDIFDQILLYIRIRGEEHSFHDNAHDMYKENSGEISQSCDAIGVTITLLLAYTKKSTAAGIFSNLHTLPPDVYGRACLDCLQSSDLNSWRLQLFEF